eukprot:TRINITY_DN786_c0_g1_i2.p1 TRINITY_DN786_c0_g1~~TRINITY_DN786_c0_g1_i2.p1  ORF type:complete len:406 (-),score=150.89 TRINITY_DN786_c0_g1_i2:602-1660(-)
MFKPPAEGDKASTDADTAALVGFLESKKEAAPAAADQLGEGAGTSLSYDDFMSSLYSNKSTGGAGGSAEVKVGGKGESFQEYIENKEKERGDALVRSFGVREDMNKSGMRRAKKKTMKFGTKGKAIYQMEDTNWVGCPFLDDGDKACFCVFDGHVDKNCAVDCIEVFPQELEEALGVAGPDATDLEAVLRESFRSTDERLLHKGHEYEGATATAVYIWRTPSGERYIQVANVGDSTAFLCRGTKSYTLSLDHKVNSESERARMELEGVQLTEGQSRINGLAVARALGDHFVKQRKMGMSGEPYVSEAIRIEKEDHMAIVASDGVLLLSCFFFFFFSLDFFLLSLFLFETDGG